MVIKIVRDRRDLERPQGPDEYSFHPYGNPLIRIIKRRSAKSRGMRSSQGPKSAQSGMKSQPQRAQKSGMKSRKSQTQRVKGEDTPTALTPSKRMMKSKQKSSGKKTRQVSKGGRKTQQSGGGLLSMLGLSSANDPSGESDPELSKIIKSNQLIIN
jgi:hypothetical protein